MLAVVMGVRARLRGRWWSVAVVAVVVAIASSAVLTLAAGARRTAAAPDAFTKSVGGNADALVQQQGGAPRTAAVEALPGVASVKAMTFAFAAFAEPTDQPPNQEASNAIFFIGQPIAGRMIAGRPTNPSQPFEFVADREFVKSHHARLGQKFPVITWSRAQQEAGTAYNEPPEGVAFDGVLVGVFASTASLDAGYTSSVFSPALLKQDVGIVSTLVAVHLEPGVSSAQLRAGLDGVPGGRELSVDSGQVVSPVIRNAVDAQAQGTWIMAIVAAIATLIAIGQLLTRQARLAPTERLSLVTVGFTKTQLLVVSGATAAVPAAIGVVVGAVVAIIPSATFPAGFVRPLEPRTGISVDVVVLVAGGLLLLFGLLAWVAFALVLFNPERRRSVRATTHDSITRAAPSATAAVGARFALAGGDRSATGTVVTLTVIVTGIVAAAVFAVSLDRLVTDRARFGANYSYAVGGNSHAPTAELESALKGQPDVTAVTLVQSDQARAGRVTVDIVGIDQVRGDITPAVLSGRMATAPDEVAVGTITARDMHLHIGDSLALSGASGKDKYRVVGVVVVPGLGSVDGVGEGAVFTAEGFGRLVQEPADTMAAVRIRPGATGDARARIAKVAGGDAGLLDRPSVILNVARVRRIPAVLAALLVVLLLMSLFHAVIVSIQRRGGDLAILSAIGADRRFVGRAVHWQTTILTILPILFGVPLGLFAGATIFRAFTNRIGAVPTPALPLVLTAALALFLVVATNVVAVIPTRRARHLSTAKVLRTG